MFFYTEDIDSGMNWRGLERAIARLMSHIGWRDIVVIGGSGDQGGDILASRREKNGTTRSWVVQVKAVNGANYVGLKAINEATHAVATYGADVGVVVTNADFTQSAIRKRDELIENGFETKLWNGVTIKAFLEKAKLESVGKRILRSYQSDIVEKVLKRYDDGKRRAFYIVATGLGKTVIAASIAQQLWDRGCRRILVLCHATDLALQLEQGFWPLLTKEVPTSVFYGGLPPRTSEGVSFGLFQSLSGYLGGLKDDEFDAIIVDEAHHACAHGFRKCLNSFRPKFLIGMTATPWRGDGQSLSDIFGEPVAKVSLVDGMAMGYLSRVDYRIFCDNVAWEEIPKLAAKKISIRDLNKRLFMPQRDEAVIEEIKKVVRETQNPRIAIFSPSLDHCRHFAGMLSAEGIPCTTLASNDKIERRRNLLAFSSGKYAAIAAVDVMNEGIDVPDVNILVFLRATHSRRIFVQQLGRGLRISEGKEKVIVLDFVSDIRRIADVVELNNEGKAKGTKKEVVFLKDGIVSFTNKRMESFVQVWLEDVADLGEANDDAKLTFPDTYEYEL